MLFRRLEPTSSLHETTTLPVTSLPTKNERLINHAKPVGPTGKVHHTTKTTSSIKKTQKFLQEYEQKPFGQKFKQKRKTKDCEFVSILEMGEYQLELRNSVSAAAA